ncbi:MAG: M23 family metallopeptidase [Leptospiraceae bacterium]|nr:M23 family metallopeptidase [Leptospiraceae bacterium]MBK7057235.1 M23 family metallopeptidase [Leptospiraceae bacterium]
MRKRYIIFLLMGMMLWSKVSTIANSSKKALKVDNEFIQTLNDKQGKWLIPREMPGSVESYLREIDSNMEELRASNQLTSSEPIPMTRPLFFPYGEKYSKSLLIQGKGREIIQSDYRELIWPVGTPNSKISSKLGLRRTLMHTGIDIACPNRSPVLAANDGIILFARSQGNYGLSITIQHNINQIQTLYAHNSILLVKEGDTVSKGQIIAFSGSTGHSTGPHLHFEVRYQSVILNPEHYFPNENDKLAVLKEVDL